MPVGLEDLSNFTVLYSNGDNFTTDYLIQDTRVHSDDSNDIMFYENEVDNEKFMNYLNNYYDEYNSLNSKISFDSFYFKNLDDIILEFEEKNDVKSKNMFLTPIKIKKKL